MTSGPMTRLCLVVVLMGCFPLAGCDGAGGGGNALHGSAANNYTLTFDHVDIYRQDKASVINAYIVEYVDSNKNLPVKLVVNAPIAQGEEKSLVKSGTLIRAMPDTAQFPDMQEKDTKGTLISKIVFDTLGDIGSDVSGRFYVTFVGTGSTLNGEFSGTLKLQTAP
jgi:hypothetical protein